MSFRVRTTRRAEADAEALYGWIAEHEGQPINALRWLDGLQGAIGTLREFPFRCPFAPESVYFDREVRQILFYSHRVLFVVDGEEVAVLHVRHVARLPATRKELAEVCAKI